MFVPVPTLTKLSDRNEGQKLGLFLVRALCVCKGARTPKVPGTNAPDLPSKEGIVQHTTNLDKFIGHSTHGGPPGKVLDKFRQIYNHYYLGKLQSKK